jgi:hypothetical protein
MKINETKNQMELAIRNKISNAASEGRFSVEVEMGCISDDFKDALISEGYRMNWPKPYTDLFGATHPFRNTMWVTIYWGRE